VDRPAPPAPTELARPPSALESRQRPTALRIGLLLLLALGVGVALDRLWPALATGLGLSLAWYHLHLRTLWREPSAAHPARAGSSRGTGRVRTRRLLELLRAYRRAANLLPDAIVLLAGPERRVRWANQAAERLLGIRPSQHRDLPLGAIVAAPALLDWLAAGGDEPLLDLASPADESLRLSLRLIRYDEQLELLVARDMTKLMRLEQVRRDFVANVSHELRTPLTVVHGYLDLLDPEDLPELAPMLREMRGQSRRMTRIVEDLLTLSRLEVQEHLPAEHVAMRPLLASLRREALALSAGQHEVTLEDGAGCDLLGSAKELHSAFSNLVSNAVRYTPAGGRIRIAFEREGPGVRLAVSDSGHGIPAQHIPRITERFYRVSTSRSRETGGTGLGLSIVKHVLNLHGARLGIESEVGRGSTFACHFGPDRVLARPDDAPDAP
jgi:two-component system phosphate regulon sensor histidine kinase PhoR